MREELTIKGLAIMMTGILIWFGEILISQSLIFSEIQIGLIGTILLSGLMIFIMGVFI